MIQVSLNSREFPCPTDSFQTLGELVEFVKANIDPDAFVLNIALNGRDVIDHEWRSPISSLGNLTVEIDTGDIEEFLTPRLEVASMYVEKIREEFTAVQESFRSGAEAGSHTKLANAVQNLKAFIDWYETLAQMMPPSREVARHGYHEQVKRISEVCEQIVQQQTFRAWWALADTIERRLSPELERLQSCCVRVANIG